MIGFLPESAADILGVRASGKLSRADYRDVLAPRIQLMLTQFRTLKVLFLMDESFAGWGFGAAWHNTILDLRHRRDFAKIAMVGGPKWEQWCVRTAAAALMRGELRTFGLDQQVQAWQWLQR